MKASSFAFGCILLSLAACSAPQGKKLTSTTGGLAPVAAGPPTAAAAITAPINPLTSAANGETVSLTRNGTVTVTLNAAEKDGYKWRLSEIPDQTVLKVVSQNFVPAATPEAAGQEKWVFQAVGPGDVDVKMWYGDMHVTPMSGNPSFDFVASVSEEMKPEKKAKKTKKAKSSKVAGNL